MTEPRGVIGQTTESIGSDNQFMGLRVMRDGSLSGVDWRQAKILQGKGFHVSVGALSTPITGGGDGTVVDIDQPEAGISVPTGYAIMPIRIAVQCLTPLMATDEDEAEILIAADTAAAWAADGTVTTEVAWNMRTDAPYATACSCISACTADLTDPTLGMELAHSILLGDMNGTPANAVWGKLDLLYEPLNAPLIIGPAAIWIYWGGTVAVDGFAQIEWLEFATSDMT